MAEVKEATCKNCGELFDMNAVPPEYKGACSLHCGIEASWEEQVTKPEPLGIHTAGF